MSGHSRWAQIKRRKGVADARRSQVFTKLGREITVAARQGGGDPGANFRLRLAIERARDSNMPLENVERAIKRASGEGEGGALSEVTFEGYGPGGSAVLLDALTDNRNRTVAEIRNIFTRSGASLGESGSVTWIFDPRGVIIIDVNDADAEELALLAIDAGAEDVKLEEGTVEVHTAPDALEAVRKALEEQGITVSSAELSRVPKTMVKLEEKSALQALKLLDKLEEVDEVQHVYTNADFPNEVVEKYQG